VRIKDISNSTPNLNSVMFNLNAFMLEQLEINDYDQLGKIIVAQLDKLCKPVATIYNEYDRQSKLLRIKEVKANKGILDLAIKIGGEKLFSTTTPVSSEMYKSMSFERVEFIPSLHGASGGAVSKVLANSIDKALNLKGYLGLSFVLKGQVYGTAVIALREEPDSFYKEILKTYAHFTSDSLKRVITEQALRKSEKELRAITENITELIAMTDTEGRFTYLSGNHYNLYGYGKDELLGRYAWDIIYPEDMDKITSMFNKHITEGNGGRAEYRVVRKDGRLIWADTVGSILKEDGETSGALFITRDVTDRKHAEEALKESENRSRAILNTLPDLMFIYSRDGYYLDYHASDHCLLYVQPEQFIGKSVYEVLPEKVAALFLKAFKSAYEYKIVNYALDVPGGSKHFEARISLMDQERLIAIIRDITEQKKAEEHIRYISYHDQLTSLYNRHYFEHCKAWLKNIPVISVIMTDINSLKLVNDIYGHEAGDELLIKYAERIKKSFKDSDLFFRWGGDEFVIVLINTGEAKSWELCNRLINYCGETFVRDIPLSISVGISSKLGGLDIDKAIQEAEDMMYKNKLIESKSSKNLIVKTLLKTLSEKNLETRDHIDRMTAIGRQYGEMLSLPPSELARLETLIMLHDIGKINIDDHILEKKTALTDQEWQEIKKHPEIGYRITRTAVEFAYIAEEVLAHHEWWDGNGYPRGLQGKSIPYLSRILNLIDSYEIMSSGRPYKKKMSSEEIIEEIKNCSGSQFDPDLSEKFILFLREGISDQ